MTELNCYSKQNASSHTLFTMTFTLSVEGVDHWPSIISALYSYIGMLRHYGTNLPEWIYLELRSLNDVSYRYADEPSPEDLVETIVEDMAPHLNLPPSRLLDRSHLLFEYDPKEIQVRNCCTKDDSLWLRSDQLDFCTVRACWLTSVRQMQELISCRPPLDELPILMMQ